MEDLSNSTIWLMIFIVSVIGVGTKLMYYKVGKTGKDAVLEHIPRITPEQWEDLEVNYNRRGPAMLLLASIPVIGSAVAAAAGALDTRTGIFIILVFVSNLIRNWAIVFLLDEVIA